jgi:hypothetical protein
VVGGGGGAGYVTPPTTGWTQTNPGTATFTVNPDSSRMIQAPFVGGDNWRIETRLLNFNVNYTVEMCLPVIVPNYLTMFAGLILMDNAGAFIQFGISYDAGVGGQQLKIDGIKWNSATSFASDYNRIASTAISQDVTWFRARDNGVNRYLECSNDGQGWVTIFSQLRTDFITPTKVGYGIMAVNATPPTPASPAIIALKSFKEV